MTLKILKNGFEKGQEILLKKSGKWTMEVNRLWTLGLEIFKALQDVNSVHIRPIL